jgi:hypothetical protein
MWQVNGIILTILEAVMNNHPVVIDRALKIIEHDGHHSFAQVLGSFKDDLLRGVDFADNADAKLSIKITLNLLGCGLHTWKKPITNLSTFTHYYDPDTQAGLDLQAYGSLENLVDSAGFLAGLIFAPGLSVDISSTPELMFDRPYPSAADRCQEEYDLAVATWHGTAGYPWADAMFHLGWACHFLADLCVSTHTVSDRFWDHGSYEDRIVAVANEKDVHLQGIGSLGQYQTNVSAKQMAIDAATETHGELALYDNNQWDDAAYLAIPRAERYTARLLVKFLQEVGVASQPLPLEVRVLGEHPIPNALVFYRHPGEKWRHVTTDPGGVAHIALKPNETIQLRPAVPGYKYDGDYDGDAPTIPEFHGPASPVVYTHSPNPLQQAKIFFNLERTAAPVMPRWVLLDTVLRWTGGQGSVRIFDKIAPADDMAAAAWAEQVVIEANEPAGPGLVMGGGVPLDIGIQVCTTAAMPGRVLKTRAGFEHVVEPHRTAWTGERLAQARLTPAPQLAPDRMSRAVIHRLDEAAPQHLERIHLIESPDLEVHHTVLGHTMTMALPIAGEHRVTVQLVQTEGLVGYGCAAVPDLEGNTDLFGRAVVKVFAGDQAGLIRLRVTVAPVDPHADPSPAVSRTIEAIVSPDGGGPDVAAPASPRFEILAMPG